MVKTRSQTAKPSSKSGHKIPLEKTNVAKQPKPQHRQTPSRKSQPSPPPSNPFPRLPDPPKSNTKNRQAILLTLHNLLTNLKQNSTICPSQIPRTLHANQPGLYPDWRGMMDEVREVVWEFTEGGRVEVTQGGEVVRAGEWVKGPIRVRRGKGWDGGELG